MGGLTSVKTWTKEEVDVLIANYNVVTNSRLSELLPNKTPLAIYKKAYKLGLRKTAEIEFCNRSEARKGERSSNWNGGQKITRYGYRQILCPDHPRADVNGYVMEHIFVWERATNIPVPIDCCVHHLNGDKTDNRIQNLCLMKKSAHTAYHNSCRVLSEETKKKISDSRRKSNYGT
jgi:hypothetical protein